MCVKNIDSQFYSTLLMLISTDNFFKAYTEPSNDILLVKESLIFLKSKSNSSIMFLVLE